MGEGGARHARKDAAAGALPENLTLANASKSVRVLYASTNGIDGKTPIAVSGAVYLPKGEVPSKGWPLIAWAHGTTGIADVCAPSWAARSQRDTDYLNAWLANGFAIAGTDYQGLGTPGGHPWEVVRPEAWSALDSARAALSAFPELSNSVVIVGQSQGAHAALSAGMLAGKYAPDIKLKGTVATGVPWFPELPPPVKASYIPVPPLGSAAALVFVLRLFELRVVSPDFRPGDYLSDAAKTAFEAARTGCNQAITSSLTQNQVTAGNVYKKDPAPEILKIAPAQQYPFPKFAQPVFIGAGLADVTVWPEAGYDFAVAACATGSVVQMHYYPGQDHSGTVNASLVDSVPFVKKLLAGEKIENGCGGFKPPPP